MGEPFERLKGMMSEEFLRKAEEQTDKLILDATLWCRAKERAEAENLWQELVS